MKAFAWRRVRTSNHFTYRCHSLLFGVNRGLDGLIHLAVASATAEIATECATNFCFSRIRIGRQYVFHCHDESWRAETALRASPVAICLLDCSKTAVLAHSLDSGDRLSFATGGQHCAGQH